ncbi:hypothetical protein [Algoriphagus sp. NG3]|uniref:hypothetical protein n=1 Tax=Algoriphagus sp. NG3 TaxID=3097546 RepID=UPI002A7F8CA5|nr:hypothetical protein [Algoriphagus sp. NG3]WPR76028.1 hypothetical protein SLW71_01530 [Algoriphagus sp. NG3]
MPSTEIELDIAILLQAFHVLFVLSWRFDGAHRPKTGDGRPKTEVCTVIARTKDEAISVAGKVRKLKAESTITNA